MKTKPFYPDYNHSILNISNALLQHYGVRTDYPALPKLKEALKRNPKNVILIILDGMGIDMMEHDLSVFSFLRRHIKEKITSVFPSTTVAATTTYYSGLPPIVHGWLGWAPYFKDLGHVVELFTNKDFYTGEEMPEKVMKRLPYTHIFDRIKAVNKNVQMTEVFPKKIRENGVSNIDELCARIIKQSKKPGNQFIIGYSLNPDGLSHKFGPYSKEVKDNLKELNAKMKQLCANLDDALIIISADHGHIQNEDIFLNDYPDIIDCLAVPLALDGRTQAVYLKPRKEKDFFNAFNKHFAKDFILLKSKEALKMKLFGSGKEHRFAKDFLGDYLIIPQTSKTLVQRFENDVYNFLPGMHSSITNKEMLVPLILVEK